MSRRELYTEADAVIVLSAPNLRIECTVTMFEDNTIELRTHYGLLQDDPRLAEYLVVREAEYRRDWAVDVERERMEASA